MLNKPKAQEIKTILGHIIIKWLKTSNKKKL